MAATIRSFVPAHSRWMTLSAGHGPQQHDRLALPPARGRARHDLPPAVVGVGASTPSCRCRVRGHSSSRPEKSWEIMTTVRPGVASQLLQKSQQPTLTRRVQPGERLVEDERARRTGQQPGQHHAAHLAAAELIDASLRQRRIQADDRQRLAHPPLVVRSRSPPPMRSPDRRGCASIAGGPPGTRSRRRQPDPIPARRRAGSVPAVGTVSPAMIHASVDFPDPLRPWISKPSPSLTVKVMSRKAVAAQGVPLPYSWLTPFSSSTGVSEWWPIATVAAGADAVSTMSVLSAAPPFR